jgi:signal transduction histidine kinase
VGLAVAALVTVLLAGLASWWLSRSFMRPVAALTDAAEQLAQGDLGQRVPVERPDELGRLARSFNAMAANLEEQEKLRRTMVGDIAHELRTPLSNVRGYLEAVQEGVVSADAATIDSLHEETLLLSRLIQDLQELSLAEAGQLRLTVGPVDVAELLDAARRSGEPAAREQQVTLTVDALPDLPPVAADAERMGQVLRNLLANAIRHTPVGGTVTLAAAAEKAGVAIRVVDSGPGIAPEHLPYVFERFYRVESGRERATGGAGLGLAIAKALVARQGGRLSAESAPDAGATFTVWLPAAEA